MIGGWAEDIAQLVVAQFPDIEFRVCNQCDCDLEIGLSEQGKVKWLKLSDDVKEMFDWGIDADPYIAPTPENWEALRQHQRAHVQEMIDLGSYFARYMASNRRTYQRGNFIAANKVEQA